MFQASKLACKIMNAGDAQLLKRFILNGYQPNYDVNSQKMNSLAYICSLQKDNVSDLEWIQNIEFLMGVCITYGGRIDKLNMFGRSPYHWACAAGNYVALKYILEHYVLSGHEYNFDPNLVTIGH